MSGSKQFRGKSAPTSDIKTDSRRRLPSVDRILNAVQSLSGAEQYNREHIVEMARGILDQLRLNLENETAPDLADIAHRVLVILESQEKSGLRRVVNGTGIVLHTNLGRAVLAQEALDALAELEGCCDLQIDMETGERGRRDGRVESLLRSITGAEAATVVNNNAAATLLVLAACCRDREVIVSRGQLIEIGGSFRLPDVIAQSGARLVEVGTTNKTHLRDYANAITGNTGAILRVNPSNYRVVGFTKEVSIQELVSLKKDHGIPIFDDLGCGCLVDLSLIGLPREPAVQDSIAAGADLALFSGDKLIGGPQAGIIAGRKAFIDIIRRHPLARALRVGKFTIAALEATLKLFLHPESLWDKNPTLRMLALKPDELRQRASSLAARLNNLVVCEVMTGDSLCGGGALPDTKLETVMVSLKHPDLSAEDFARALRLGEPAVVPRIQEEAVLIDMRTLLPGDDDRIESAVRCLMDRDKHGLR